MPVPVAEAKAQLFKALGHPARVRILEVLAAGERSVGDLSAELEMEPSHLSQQLAVLRHAGVVTTRKERSSVFYSIKPPELVELLAVAKRLLLNNLAETRRLLDQLQATGRR